MRHTKKESTIGATALLILGLIVTLFLVVITDGARLFGKKNNDRMRVEILLENLDSAVAEALPAETSIAPEGGAPCSVLEIDAPTAQWLSTVTQDGSIRLLPSPSLLCTKITLEIPGVQTEDGFLAFGSRRLLIGASIRLSGERITAEGKILSLTPTET